MRDINRIDPFLSQLREVWMQNPDWRFGQLVDNVACRVDCDLFYIEDDVFLKVMLGSMDSKKIIQTNRLGLPVIMSGGKTMLEAYLEDKRK